MFELLYIALIAAQFAFPTIIILAPISQSTAWMLFGAQVICAVIQGYKFPSFSLRTAANASLGFALANIILQFYIFV